MFYLSLPLIVVEARSVCCVCAVSVRYSFIRWINSPKQFGVSLFVHSNRFLKLYLRHMMGRHVCLTFTKQLLFTVQFVIAILTRKKIISRIHFDLSIWTHGNCTSFFSLKKHHFSVIQNREENMNVFEMFVTIVYWYIKLNVMECKQCNFCCVCVSVGKSY